MSNGFHNGFQLKKIKSFVNWRHYNLKKYITETILKK